jgi:hypothetical protein
MKPKLFYSSFESGLLAACGDRVTRLPGKLPKFAAQTPAGALNFFFEVNPKSGSMPGWPGNFRPVIEAAELRYSARDDGTVSWYQFADEAMMEAMRAQQRSVLDKVAAQASVPKKDVSPDEAKLAQFLRDSLKTCLNMMRADLAQPFEPRLPHAPLYYLDEADAQRWGALLGAGLDAWIARWRAEPETLEAHMWRVHWKDLPRA